MGAVTLLWVDVSFVLSQLYFSVGVPILLVIKFLLIKIYTHHHLVDMAPMVHAVTMCVGTA